MGGFGNQLFQYAFARGYARKHGFELQTDPWIGQKIFEIEDPPIEYAFPRMGEHEIELGKGDVSFLGYAQNQKCADYYSLEDIRSWFKLRPEIAQVLSPIRIGLAAHVRNGDYAGSGYPVVGKEAIVRAAINQGYDPDEIVWFSPEYPLSNDALSKEMSFLQDFWDMKTASVLFRSNSTFSWWAGALSDGLVYSPRIDGLKGGIEHDDVPFELGNHCKTADLPFITDIHLRESNPAWTYSQT